MLTTLKIITFLGIFVLLTQFLPTVNELPFGIEPALILFVSSIKGILTLMPWMATPWNLFLIALLIKSLLFAWHWVKWFIETTSSLV